MTSILYINEDRVRSLMDWNSTLEAVEAAMKGVSAKRVFQNPRTFTSVLEGADGVLLTMPGYLQDANYGALGCKLVTSFVDNENRKPPLPSILANIALFDDTTGELKAIVAGTEITTWRTAAASAAATKYLRKGRDDKVLAILGAGVQGKAHAIAFQHFFKYKEVRIWNRTQAKAVKLAEELNSTSSNKEFKVFDNAKDCVNGADVIVTATSSINPILKLEYVKEGVHINSVGSVAGHHHAELEESLYKSADIFIDYWAGAKTELAGLEKIGIQFKGEVGGLIEGSITPPPTNKITIFQSLGMAVEDCAMARMIYDKEMKTKK